MPAKDRYHDAVKAALRHDDWNIIGEQVRLTIGDHNLWIDLHAQKSPDDQAVLIEVKELYEVASPVEALASAVGKYLLYRVGLSYLEQEIPLYLAVTTRSYSGVLSSPLGQEVLKTHQIKVLVFDAQEEKIIRWTP